MSKSYVINPNGLLKGEVNISGSKNCALCLIAGALLAKGKTILHNIPKIKDIEMFIKILNYLNVKTSFSNNTLEIDTTDIIYRDLDIEEIKSFRGSYYLIGALINQFKHLKISNSGGCNFVSRPINFHIDLFKKFGINSTKKDDIYTFDLVDNNEIEHSLPYPSFGATINGLLYAVSSNRYIVLKNLSNEVEIYHFIKMLKLMGANIFFDKNIALIEPSNLKPITFKNIPDRIETGTFLLMGPTICSYLKINNICPIHNKEILDMFSLLDIDYELGDDYVILKKTNIKKSCFIETGIENHISSDLQPLLTVFCLTIPRISVIKEKVYSSRFTHIEPLKKMGAAIYESNQNILINGIMSLQGQEVNATDLRMSASMVFASLVAEGKSIIHNIDYIDRGYENFAQKLNSLGADIKVYEN